MSQLILKIAGCQSEPNLIMWAFKSRELSPAGIGREGKEGMSEIQDMRKIQHTISSLEDGGNHFIRNAGDL